MLCDVYSGRGQFDYFTKVKAEIERVISVLLTTDISEDEKTDGKLGWGRLFPRHDHAAAW